MDERVGEDRFLTGAGISTESGIPDIGPNGMWTTKPESIRLVNIED